MVAVHGLVNTPLSSTVNCSCRYFAPIVGVPHPLGMDSVLSLPPMAGPPVGTAACPRAAVTAVAASATAKAKLCDCKIIALILFFYCVLFHCLLQLSCSTTPFHVSVWKALVSLLAHVVEASLIGGDPDMRCAFDQPCSTISALASLTSGRRSKSPATSGRARKLSAGHVAFADPSPSTIHEP
jgi:hypothetical protein